MSKDDIKYVAPKAKVIEINALAIICLSNGGNESFEEVDYGDGGFSDYRPV